MTETEEDVSRRRELASEIRLTARRLLQEIARYQRASESGNTDVLVQRAKKHLTAALAAAAAAVADEDTGETGPEPEQDPSAAERLLAWPERDASGDCLACQYVENRWPTVSQCPWHDGYDEGWQAALDVLAAHVERLRDPAEAAAEHASTNLPLQSESE